MGRNDPVFVIGFGRCGTTLLQALIGAHPRIAAPPEMRFFGRIVAHADNWGDLGDDGVLRAVIARAVGMNRIRSAGFDVDRLFDRARDRPRDYANLIDAIMSDFAERQGKQRWSEKTPLQSAREIWQVFPDAQVVHITRNPQQNVPSHLAKLGVFGSIAEASVGWRLFIERNEQDGLAKGPAHYMHVRYEDLVTDPDAVMREVIAFLGEDYDEAIVTDASRRAPAVGAGHELIKEVLQPIRPDALPTDSRLSSADRARIAAATAPAMRRVGYPTPSGREVVLGRLLNTPTLVRARARTSMRRLINAVQTPEQRLRAHQRRERKRGERMKANRSSRG